MDGVSFDLFDLLVPGGTLAVLSVIARWLIHRGDIRDRDAFAEVKEQRDEWRARAERAEHAAFECGSALARYHLRFGDLPDVDG